LRDWKPDLKRYPHFDQVLSLKEIDAIVKDPRRVAENAFFPFMRYSKGWQPFRETEDDQKPKPKERPIRFAARRDAYIFAYYRSLLAERYEAELAKLEISHCPLAYRRIANDADPMRGKCNIHFAHDAFKAIQKLGDCCVIALDISSYFDSIDHEKLKILWCRLLDQNRLPADHFALFEAITKYSFVEKLDVYQRLGYYGVRKTGVNGKPIMGYLTPFREIPTQLCNPATFRDKIVGKKGGYSTLIQRNKEKWGIPQGAPISDLLANLYLIDFDVQMNQIALDKGGSYFRYSDDIILILPVVRADAAELMSTISESIKDFGDQLQIKPTKSSLIEYRSSEGAQTFELISGTQGAHGVEYLGFRFDGKGIYLRDSTLSNLHRRIAFSARNQAEAAVSRYQEKDYAKLCKAFDFEQFSKRFARVEDFENNDEYRKWTFWTYVTRAKEEFGEVGKPISRQMRNLKRSIRYRVEVELQRALVRKAKREAASPRLTAPHNIRTLTPE
jgi:hypothetical protein